MIKINNLSVAFDNTEVVKNVNLKINDGEILGIVGESGSGKSVMALTIMGLKPEAATVNSGTIDIDGVTADAADNNAFEKGSQISMVFQEPMTSLNPTMKIGRQVEEVLKLHTDMDAQQRKKKVLESFESVGLKATEIGRAHV